MKALLFASFVATTLAGAVAPTTATGCVIPSEYAAGTGAMNSCANVQAGYTLNVICYNLGMTVPPIRQALDANTASGYQAATIVGCVIPGSEIPIAPAMGVMGATNAAVTLNCPAWDVTMAAPLAVKGLEVGCAANYYPVQGVPALFTCGTSAADQAMSQNPATLARFVPEVKQTTSDIANPNTRLLCRQGCQITDPTICQNSQLQVAGTTYYPATATKNGVLADCTILPNSTVTFVSKTGKRIVYRCDAAATTATAGTLVLVSGAEWLNEIRKGYEAWYYGAIGQSAIPAGTYDTAVRGVRVILSNVVPAFRAVTPIPGLTPQSLIVEGCRSVECTQDALLWARCNGFVFYNDMCYADSVQIPCPTAERGFECSESSKKGLLGLLGLLGLIPLLLCCCLLLCCLFGPCALRRKKTGADVQFATFDPHAAPVAQSFVAQPCMPVAEPYCAPMEYCAPTACATGYVA